MDYAAAKRAVERARAQGLIEDPPPPPPEPEPPLAPIIPIKPTAKKAGIYCRSCGATKATYEPCAKCGDGKSGHKGKAKK